MIWIVREDTSRQRMLRFLPDHSVTSFSEDGWTREIAEVCTQMYERIFQLIQLFKKLNFMHLPIVHPYSVYFHRILLFNKLWNFITHCASDNQFNLRERSPFRDWFLSKLIQKGFVHCAGEFISQFILIRNDQMWRCLVDHTLNWKEI